MDNTEQVIAIQKRLHSLIGHEGWVIARDRLVQKIMDLQNAFNIKDSDAQQMLIDLQARKIATNILYEWLQDIEGTAQQYETTSFTLKKEEYIIREG